MSEIYIWFAEPKPVYGSDGERFIRAWTDNPDKVAVLRDAIGKEPMRYRAEVQAEATRVECEWFVDDYEASVWSSGCGELWGFGDGGPIENKMKFCHACGKPLTVRAASSAGDQT